MIELDIVPFLTKPAPFSPETGALADAVERRIYYSSAPEHAPYPYIVVEGPVDSEEFQFADAVCLRGVTGLRFQVFAASMTETRRLLYLITEAISPLRDLFFQTSYVQAFFRGQLLVENRQLQRGKQERPPDGDENPLASGSVDYSIWTSHRNSFMSGETTKIVGADGGDTLTALSGGKVNMEAGSILEIADGVLTTVGIGAPAGTGVTAVEKVLIPHQTVISLAATSITMTDATTAGCHGSRKIFDLPAGNILILGATTDLQVTAGTGGISDTAAVVGAVGSVAAATDNGTLTSTEANIVPSTASTLTAGAGSCDGESTAPVTLDGTATAADVYLNFAIPDAGSSANDTLLVTGTVTITWINLGDN